jgi:hypothetical protein
LNALQPEVEDGDDLALKLTFEAPTRESEKPTSTRALLNADEERFAALQRSLADRDQELQSLRAQLASQPGQPEQAVIEGGDEGHGTMKALDIQRGAQTITGEMDKDRLALEEENVVEMQMLKRLLAEKAEELEGQKELSRQHRVEADGHEQAHDRERKRVAIVEKALADSRRVADGHQEELTRLHESTVDGEGRHALQVEALAESDRALAALQKKLDEHPRELTWAVAQEKKKNEVLEKDISKSNNEAAFQRDLAISRHEKAVAAEKMVAMLEKQLAEQKSLVHEEAPALEELQTLLVSSREEQRMAEERVQTLEVEAALGAAGLAATTSLDTEVEELMEEIANLQLQNQRLAQENVRLSEETVSQKDALKEVSSRHSRLSASAQELAGRARDAEVVAFALSEEMETIHEMVPKAKVEAEKALADAEEFEARLEEEKAMVLAEAEQAAQEQLEEQLEIKERQLESELASQGLESQQALDTARELAAKHKDALSEANKKMEDLRKEVATVLLPSIIPTPETYTGTDAHSSLAGDQAVEEGA